MSAQAERGEALEWVLAKLSAKKSTPKAPVFKPPELKLPKPAAPVAKPVVQQTRTVLTDAQKAKRREHEHVLWEQYRDAPNKGEKQQAYQALLKSQANLLNRRLADFAGIEVNKTAQRAAAIEMARRAYDTFDPSKGASLSTWVTLNLKPMKRYNVGLQNAAVRVTEPTSQLITPYRTAKEELSQKLGYEPTNKQIVEHTHSKKWSGPKLSEKDVLQVQAIGKSYDIEAGGEQVEGAGLHFNDRYLQAAHLIYHRLKPHEQKMHELMFPRSGGKAILKSGDLAKKLGWHVSKVSKAKKVIWDLTQEQAGE